MLDNYQILYTVAKGEHSVVELVQNREGKQFSAKIMYYTTESSKQLVSNFLKNELKVLRSITSSNSVQAISSSFEGNVYKKDKSLPCVYLISSYCSLGTFEKLTKLRPLETEARHYFIKLLTNTEKIMLDGVIVLNLRLENILIDSNFNVKLCGFSKATLSDKDKVPKNPAYMAPEALALKEFKGNKVNVFALGVILFTLVIGGPPFHRASQMDSHFKTLQKNKSLFWAMFKPVSPEFKEVVEGMLRENPEQRMDFSEIRATKWCKDTGNEDLSEIHAKLLRNN